MIKNDKIYSTLVFENDIAFGKYCNTKDDIRLNDAVIEDKPLYLNFANVTKLHVTLDNGNEFDKLIFDCGDSRFFTMSNIFIESFDKIWNENNAIRNIEVYKKVSKKNADHTYLIAEKAIY